MTLEKNMLSLLASLLCTACLSAGGTLDVTKGNVGKTEVTQSMLGFRDTLRFYEFVDEKAVLVIRIDNKDTNFSVAAKLFVFAADTTAESLGKWVNNQHSDGLYADAPEPAATHEIPAAACKVKSHRLIEPVESPSGNFNRYSVIFEISDVPDLGGAKLKDFTDTATVNIKEN